MTFKEGDRVLVISLKTTGTVDLVEYSGDVGAARIMLDTSEELIKKFAPIEKNSKPMELQPGDHIYYHTFTSDLEHLKSSKPEPDWKDIWDSGAE